MLTDASSQTFDSSGEGGRSIVEQTAKINSKKALISLNSEKLGSGQNETKKTQSMVKKICDV